MELAELDRDELLRRTLQRGEDISRARARRRRIVRVVPAVGLALVLTASVVTVAALHDRGSSQRAAATTTTPLRASSVKVLLPAKGFVAVDLGLAQISVPGRWTVEEGSGCLTGRPSGVVYVDSRLNDYCPNEKAAWEVGPVVVVNPVSWAPVEVGSVHSVITVNGFRVERYVHPSEAVTFYVIARLGVYVSVYAGTPDPIQTLSYSPRAAVLLGGAAPAVPASWRRFSAGGVSLAVPASWLVDGGAYVSTVEGQQCSPDYSLSGTGRSLTIVGSDAATPPSITPCFSYPQVVHPAIDGLVVNVKPGASWPGGTKGACLEIHGLKTCFVSGLPATDILFAWVTVPHRSRPVLLEIGLAGTGMTARTILYSLRR
jgi:hypothetical protein